jgi:hypothetical protein
MGGEGDFTWPDRSDCQTLCAERFCQGWGFVLPVGDGLADQDSHGDDIAGGADRYGAQRRHEGAFTEDGGEPVEGADRGPWVAIDPPCSPPGPHPHCQPLIKGRWRDLRPYDQPQD